MEVVTRIRLVNDRGLPVGNRAVIFVMACSIAFNGALVGQAPPAVPAVPSMPATPPTAAPGNPVPEGPLGGNPAPATPLAASPTAAAAPSDPLRFQSGPVRVKWGFEAIGQGSFGADSWWNLSKRFAPDATFNPDRVWAEGWFKPSARTDVTVSEWLQAYSGASIVGSGNLGRDLFEEGNRGLLSVEDAYLGVRFGNSEEQRTLDLSYGRQPYKIGSGMLIGVGASNGFERGAATIFARRAWAEAALAKANWGPFSFDTFYLRPNELRSSDTGTHLAGGKAEFALGENQYAGIASINVLESNLPYLGAPVRFFESGRDGLRVIHTYTRVNPLREALPGLYVAGDFAYQWNDRIDLRAFAYSGEVGHRFGNLPFQPTAAYAFRHFSGDDPGTAALEKFDPLFYEGSPPLWSSGSNGSFVFINSNVLAHRVSLALTVTPRDYVNLYYWHVRAAQVNSPLQFGMFARLDVTGGEPKLVSGVPNAHLSDDFYAEYTRAVSQNIFVTTGLSVSIPGRGLKAVAPETTTWFGGLMNVAIRY